MKRTLTSASIELLLEELEYEKIHCKNSEDASAWIGHHCFTRTSNAWELERFYFDKNKEITGSDFLVSVGDSLYHKDVASIMLAAIAANQ